MYGNASEIMRFFYGKLFSGIDPLYIGYMIISLVFTAVLICVLIRLMRVTFKCPHCSNTFQKVIFGGQRGYVRRHGKDSEKHLRCPFCKKENLCRYIPTEEEKI